MAISPSRRTRLGKDAFVRRPYGNFASKELSALLGSIGEGAINLVDVIRTKLDLLSRMSLAGRASPRSNPNISTQTARDMIATMFGKTITAKTSGYALRIIDAGTTVQMNSASGLTLTVPHDTNAAFGIGEWVEIVQWGGGQVTVAAASGVIIQSNETLLLKSQYSKAMLTKMDTNEWLLDGDLAA